MQSQEIREGHIILKYKPQTPRGWTCECGNVLGVRYRNNLEIMVLDAFRVPVSIEQLKVFVEQASRIDYSALNLVRGEVVCVKCGRSNTWDASDVLFKRLMRNRAQERLGSMGDNA